MESNAHIQDENALRFALFCRIEEEEYKALSLPDRTLGYRSTIQTTAYLTEGLVSTTSFSAQTTFHPSISPTLFIAVWMVFALLAIIDMLAKPKQQNYIIGMVVFVIGILLGFINLTSAKFNYLISLTKQGIRVGNYFYDWQSILDIYMVRRPGGKKDIFFLIIGLRNGELVRCNLWNFPSLFSNKMIDKLIKAIEYYKQLALKQ